MDTEREHPLPCGVYCFDKAVLHSSRLAKGQKGFYLVALQLEGRQANYLLARHNLSRMTCCTHLCMWSRQKDHRTPCRSDLGPSPAPGESALQTIRSLPFMPLERFPYFYANHVAPALCGHKNGMHHTQASNILYNSSSSHHSGYKSI